MGNRFTLDTDLLSIEMQLLLALVQMDHAQNVTEKHKKLLHETNWDAFIELARHHRVYPYLYPKLKDLGTEWVPPYVIRTFHRDYRMNAFQMLHMSGEIETIGKPFTEQDIRILYLKGPVIAQDLYGDISLRMSCDLDLLIPLSDLPKAEAILITLGYVKDDYIHTILSDWKWRHHHTTFTHPVRGIKIELHWRLNPAPSKEPRFDELWNRRRKSPLTSHPAYYLGREDLFLFLVSHGSRHGWSRLRWLVDIKLILAQRPDAAKLTGLLRKHHQSKTGGQALLLASELLGAPVADDWNLLTMDSRSRRLARDAMFYLERLVNLHTIPVPEEVEKYHKHHQFSLLTLRQQLLFFLSLLFPFPEDAQTLPLPKPLHFLYFPLRPWLWAWRKTRKHVVNKAGN